MDISGMYVFRPGVNQRVKSTTFTDDDDNKHVIYHITVARKPLCVHMYTEHVDNSVTVYVDHEKWSSIKHWYFACLDDYDCCEEVYREDLLHLFKGL